MERRHFLKLTMGFAAGAAGAAALASSAQAAPMLPAMPAQGLVPPRGQAAAATEELNAQPAIATQDDVDRLAPEQVRWGRRRRWVRRRVWGLRVRRRRWRW